jgi:gamma-tubulin complex component 2
LTLLHERTTSALGNPSAQQLLQLLMEAAAAPYFALLQQWVYKGIIDDPYLEFFVEEEKTFNKEKLATLYNDLFWEQRYTLCLDRVPMFLTEVFSCCFCSLGFEHVLTRLMFFIWSSDGVGVGGSGVQQADKILRTGKYLNVIRECGRDVSFPEAEPITYHVRERNFTETIERAYTFASRAVLDLLMGEMQLMERLRSIKRYFLLEQGDFFVQFMDAADGTEGRWFWAFLPPTLTP